MNKTAIKNFAVWARRKLISDITYKAGMLGITDSGIAEPLPISTKDLQFFDIGTKDYAEVSGNEIAQRKALVDAIKRKEKTSKTYKEAFEYIVEEVAYTWFNRLIAIRFMEVNDYLPSGIRVLSSENPAKNEPDFVTTPFDTDLEFTPFEQDKVVQLKDENKLDELFRMLFIKQCNKLHEILPELFEKTDDYTELLLTISFTDTDGVVSHLVHDIEEKDFDIETVDENGKVNGQVEIIGWLYQYYNTEQNEMVYDGNFSKSRLPKELLPAATTIYTPDWAIKYMVQNSLGKLWEERSPECTLKSNWEYFLNDLEQDDETQKKLDNIGCIFNNITPEEIMVLDPCMGSGHILVYAFEVLMQIYESYGYTQRDAARSILINNIHGLDIDTRAYQFAYFAVMMKARQYNRRILTEGITPNLFAIKESNEISNDLIKFISNGDANIEKDLTTICDELHDATEYGSILNITNVNFEQLYKRIEEIKDSFYDDIFGQGYQMETTAIVLPLIKQAHTMAQKYHVVVTNPPYLGNSRFSPKLDKYIKDNYQEVKHDLSMVMYKHALENLVQPYGFVSFITTNSWMTLSRFESIRNYVLLNHSFDSIVDFGTELFEGKVGHNPIVAWINRANIVNKKMIAIRLVEYCYSQKEQKQKEFFNKDNYYYPNQKAFLSLAGKPIAYSFSNKMLRIFETFHPLSEVATTRLGMTTADNNKFTRLWFEVDYNNCCFDAKNERDFLSTNTKWVPYNKGGKYRKWYGNHDCVVNWQNSGFEIKNFADEKGHIRSTVPNTEYYFLECATWSKISSGSIAFRYRPCGSIFDVAGACLFAHDKIPTLMAFLNSNIAMKILSVLSPTLNYEGSHIASLPIQDDIFRDVDLKKWAAENIALSKEEWDEYEFSWEFKRHPLLNNTKKLSEAWEKWKEKCDERFAAMKANEEKINKRLAEIYGLEDEISFDVSDKYISVRRADREKDIKSLLSYIIGCLLGRYSLDYEGIAYAGGEWNDKKCITIIPDEDNCIPITDEEYFEDDVVGKIEYFLKKAFGVEHVEENLDYIASSLDCKGQTSREIIRNYFLNNFIKEHASYCSNATSGKRPIYWMFDSGKQNGFKAICYMHRWNEDTIGNMRVEYLHRMQRVYEKELERMQDTIDNSRDNKEISAATKRKEKLQKQLKETKEYDAKVAHLALSRIGIDLDDGVKVNYEKVQTASDGTKLDILAKI